MNRKKTLADDRLHARAARRIIPIVLALTIILLGGLVAWAALAMLNDDDKGSDEASSSEVAERVDLYPLGEWGVVVSLPADIARNELTTVERKNERGEMEAVALSTDKVATNASVCGINDGVLITMYRHADLSTIASSQLMASTGKIGEYYYAYERAIDTIDASCGGEDRAILETETKRLELAISTVQLQ